MLRAATVALVALPGLFGLAGLSGPAPLFGSTARAGQALPAPGWERVDLPGAGTYAWRYLPVSASPSDPLPVVVFLHGSGATPELWRPFLSGPAEATGAVVIAPAPADLDWGLGDDQATISEALTRVGSELPLDRARIGLAGHSAGGAYAYFLAYETVGRFSAVFAFSAPFRFVLGVADPRYTAPLRLWYGTLDPNYLGGQFAAIALMMSNRGVPVDSRIVPGLGHDDIRQEDLTSGFAFLLAHRYPLKNTLSPKSGTPIRIQPRPRAHSGSSPGSQR